jgi:hypothetical protein
MPQPMPEVVQYSKVIAPDVSCYIDFQLKQFFRPPVRQFDVILGRIRLSGYPRNELRYAQLHINLWQFMWLVHGIQIGPVDKQWEFTNNEDLKEQVVRAQTLLFDYGIPWLENPSTRDPSAVSALERETFLAVLEKTSAKELTPLGYKLETVTNAENPCFVKTIHDNLKIFIEFRLARLIHPPQFEVEEYQIDVRLGRGAGATIYDDESIASPYWLDTSLGGVLWSEFGVYPGEFAGWETLYKYIVEEDKQIPVKVPPPAAYVWQYTDRTQLEKRLQDITGKIKRYAIPWLEDLKPKSP